MKNPHGYCECGCGQRTPPSPTSRRGYKKGEPLRFIRGHSSRRLRGAEWRGIDRGYETPCHIWQKYKDQNGYGKTWNGEMVVHAHRHYYDLLIQPVPKGMELHHLCGQRDCVNIDHLELVTRREHMAIEGRRPFGNPKAPIPTMEENAT